MEDEPRFQGKTSGRRHAGIVTNMSAPRVITLATVFVIATAGLYLAGSRERHLSGTAEAAAASTRPAHEGGRNETMKVRISSSGYDITPLPRDAVAKLAAKLDPEAYRVTQKAGTEPAFCGRKGHTQAGCCSGWAG